jgi:glyoxylate/hydroxypyruvate reductase
MSALAVIIQGWTEASWFGAMPNAMPERDLRFWPDLGRLEDIVYAAVWKPPQGVLQTFPNLKLIFSLGAGVDAILADPTVPEGIPLVRVADSDLTNRMSEYVVMHCLMHMRQQRRLDQHQRDRMWHSLDQHAASAMTVGVMGLGVLGTDAATKLKIMGFNVVGWSRSRKSLAGLTCFAGEPELTAFLGQSDILVCLLPATTYTDGILNRDLIDRLSRNGPFGAPILINAGRGRLNNETDILACLDTGALHAATLDVFREEPLPADSRFWHHPEVTLTPHSAADSDPATICRYVATQIARFEAGEPLQNRVDRARGY